MLRTVPGVTGAREKYVFSRNGFSARLRDYAATLPRLHLVTPQEIYT
ncbi:hypothetical protein Psi01_18440 [Planobispora siamensis]|uniref:Uncharacterized protein n=1 Tax=Planobispora siamensis TaxID=936338 RepID=A0A8J3SD81_9ACTN|nr:hypothetical protein [Planobispora siamensis]GIH91214.1 hypothetical protein Psi01_18440 [Planobispora siamensis]